MGGQGAHGHNDCPTIGLSVRQLCGVEMAMSVGGVAVAGLAQDKGT